MGTDDERAHRALLDRVMRRLVGLPLDVTPPQVGQIIHRLGQLRIVPPKLGHVVEKDLIDGNSRLHSSTPVGFSRPVFATNFSWWW